MSGSVLVTWATKYGSTEEVAQTVAAVLRDEGIAVDARRPLHEIETLDRIDAVVLGCALYMGRMHRDVRRFLSTHRHALGRMPVAIFVLGPVHKEEGEFAQARRHVDKGLARFPWLHPQALEIFGGVWNPAKLSFPFKWTLRSVPALDARDWDAIRSWAHTVAAGLHSGVAK